MTARAHWFTTAQGVTGVVEVTGEDGQRRYYISAVRGRNERKDIEYIVSYGARFPWAAGELIFEHGRLGDALI